MTKIDGGLSPLLRRHLPDVDWVRIESGLTSLGIPDLNYAFGGREGWLELKVVKAGFKIGIRPHQVAWIERRIRHGGRVFILVRKGDDGWLFHGRMVRTLLLEGLRAAEAALVHCQGAPANWDWHKIQGHL